MINRMKRLFVIFLIMLLPLQISLAAVHVCGESIDHTSLAKPANSLISDSGLGEMNAIDEKKDLTDTCCSIGHGCNGLHTLIAMESAESLFGSGAHLIDDLTSQVTRGAPNARHERPKWPAA